MVEKELSMRVKVTITSEILSYVYWIFCGFTYEENHGKGDIVWQKLKKTERISLLTRLVK